MKKTITLLFASFYALLSYAQTNIPQLVSFSAVVRDADNQPLENTDVSIRLTFKEGGQEGPLVYCALHQTTTNQNGFMSLQLNREVLGTGCNGAPSTAFEEIPWINGDFWMEVEYQTTPNSPFVNLGQLELASSFYAFAAGTAESIAGFDLSDAEDGDVLTYNITTEQWEAMPASGGFSGDYNDLTNTPITISSISDNGDTLHLSNGQTFIAGGGTGNLVLPTVTTSPVTGVGSNSAIFEGEISNANGSQIVARAFAYSTSPNPTGSAFIVGVGVDDVDVFSDSLYGPLNSGGNTYLTPNTTYYVRAFVRTENNIIVYGNEVSFTTQSVGQTGPGGGIVYFDKGYNSEGWQYLEVATSDQSTGIEYGCLDTPMPTGTERTLGSGVANTALIVADCNDPDYAAKLCDDLTLGGVSDWFLPSINELRFMYINLHLNGQGDFTLTNYWSSTVASWGGSATYFNFENGNTDEDMYMLPEFPNLYVRAVRAF